MINNSLTKLLLAGTATVVLAGCANYSKYSEYMVPDEAVETVQYLRAGRILYDFKIDDNNPKKRKVENYLKSTAENVAIWESKFRIKADKMDREGTATIEEARDYQDDLQKAVGAMMDYVAAVNAYSKTIPESQKRNFNSAVVEPLREEFFQWSESFGKNQEEIRAAGE